MISRIFARTVLVAIVAVMVWLVGLTWSIQLGNISRQIFLIIIEGGVLLAALSLLIESFRSFGTITVNKNSPWYVLSGLYIFDEISKEEKGDIISARTCELFMFRSLILAFIFLALASVISVLVWAVVEIIQFLYNPYIPTVSWVEIVSSLELFVPVALALGLLILGGQSIEKKLANKKKFVRVMVLGLYWCVGIGTFLGFVIYLFTPGPGTPSLYEVVLIGISLSLAFVSISGMIFGIGYGLYRLVGKASTRFPVLGNVWNTLCPIHEIRVIR